jgi:eukaryotic-like serine/threonine-protein kinase
VTMGPEALRRLSALLDQAFELAVTEREPWLASLQGDDAALAPTLRDLLARQASQETADLFERPRAFTVTAAAPTPSEQRTGDTVGAYRLERLLGRGGMGEVWLAERSDGSLKRKVALKLPHVSWAPGLAERFARERDILAGLEHPNIARLYDAGVDQLGRPFMALEFVEGQPLDAYCKSRALPLPARLKLLLQVADAVAFAHSRLVLHRDLKPGNILVTADGQARLLDFGIAKLMEGDTTRETALTRVSGRALTLDYASPEQIRGEPIGTASDVYSLGVVAFEVLAGARPYRLKRGSAAELEEAITGADAPLASDVAADPAMKNLLKGDVDAILNKALKKTVSERYPTIDALAQDWRRHLAGEGITARPDTIAYRLTRFARRHRLPLGAGAVTVAAFGLALGFGATALVILALLAGMGAALWQARKAREQARIADAQARKALQESRRAQAVQGFLTDLFRANASRQKDPAKARATTARELLDLGAERLRTALEDAPEARAEVMNTLGEMYYQLDMEEQAAAIDAQRVDLLRAMGKDNDEQLAEALIHLAGSLHATGQRERILPALEEAQRILDARGDRNTPLRGELLVRLSQRYYNISVARAVAYADEAAAVLRAQAVVDHDMLSTALILAARARSQIGEYGAAALSYRDAIEHIVLVPDTPHFDLMQARYSLAEVLAQRQQFDVALTLAREAAEAGAAALGADAPSVIVAHSRWAALLHAAGHRHEAHQLHRRAIDAVLRVKGPDDTMYTPVVRLELARCLLAEGRLAEGLALADAVLAVYRKHYAKSAVLANGLRIHAAFALALGRTDDARRQVEEVDAILRQAGMRPWRLNRVVLDLARVELADARPDAALQVLERFTVWPDSESPPPRPDDVEREVLSARAHLQRGDPAAARSHAQAAVEAAATVAARGRLPGLEADAALVHGMALMADGRPAAARVPVERALALRCEFDDPISPWRAEAEAMHGGCLLQLGERAAAHEAAARAQAIVAANPSLAAEFMQPLQALQRALQS